MRPYLFVILAGFLLLASLAPVISMTIIVTSVSSKQIHFTKHQSISPAAGVDLGFATQNYLAGVVFPALQNALNKKAKRLGVPLSSLSTDQVRDWLHQLCMEHFPRFYMLEMRGATLDRNNFEEEIKGRWSNMMGRASLILHYDGVMIGNEVGLPSDPNVFPYAVVFTCSTPYQLRSYWATIPEDGDLMNRLGSLWRPAMRVSTGDPDRYTLEDGHKGPLFIDSNYSASGQVRCYVALALPKPVEPEITPVEFPLTTDPPCDFSNEQISVVPNPYGEGFVLATPCGGIVTGVYADQAGAQSAIDTIRGGGNLKILQEKLQQADQFSGRPSDRSTPRYPPGTWNHPQLPPTATTPGPGGTIMVPPGSNLTTFQIKFDPWISHAPGPYTIGSLN
jgi:hypothetical protein